MPPKSKYALGEHRQNANKVFTNRDNPIRWFNEARNSLQKGKHQLLTFYGVGGQGKSALCRKLGEILRDEDPRASIWGHVDFAVQAYRRADRALLELRKTLVTSSKGKIKFPAFEIAITHYWEKEYPESNVKESLKDVFDQHENILTSIVDNAPNWFEYAKDLPAGIGAGIKFLNFLRHKEREVYYKRALDALIDLEHLKNYELLEKLPYIFATDVLVYLEQEKALKPVLLIDTYEALWEHCQVKTGFGATEADAWVRSLVAELPGVLFVMFGRDKLTWEEDFPNDWTGYLDHQHLLGGLSDQDADDFLRKIPIQDSEIRAAMIAGAQGETKKNVKDKSAGAHPFYLDLGVDLYLDMLDDGKQPSPQDVGKTPRELLDRFIRYRSPEEIETLKALSVAYGFDQALFENIVSHFHTGYPLTAFIEFTNYSFIEQGQDGLYYMHALMKESLSNSLDKTTFARIRDYLFGYYNAMLPTVPKDVTERHEFPLQQAVRFVDWQQSENSMKWYFEEFGCFFTAGKFDLLILLTIEIIQKLEKILSKNDPIVGMGSVLLANCYNAKLRDQEAEALYLRSFEIFKELEPTEYDGYISVAQYTLATLYTRQNRHEEAESLFLKSLATQEKDQEDDTLKIPCMIGLALVWRTQGRYTEAEALYKKTITLCETTTSSNDVQLGATLIGLGSLYAIQGGYQEAEPFYLRGLDLREKSLPADHPDIATTLNDLAVIYHDLGKYEEAESIYFRCLRVYEKSLPLDHPNFACCFYNIAKLYHSQGNYSEAEKFYLSCLDIREKILPVDHPYIANSLNDLAVIYHNQGRYDKAEPLYLRGLSIREKILPADHPDIANSLNYLAVIYHNQGRYDKAEPLYLRSLDIRKKILPADHPDIALSLSNLAVLYHYQGRYDEAEPLYLSSLDIRQKCLPVDHPDIAVTLSSLAELYRQRGNIELAESVNLRIAKNNKN